MLPRRRSFVLFSAAAASGCYHRNPGKQRIRVVVAGTPANLAFLPHTLAQQLNLYRREGLSLALDAVPGGTKGLQALLGGSTDVVVGFYDHSIRTAALGQEVRSFAVLTRYPGNVIVTSPDTSRTIRSIKDLQHRVVGVSDLGSQSHLFLNFVLMQHGLRPSDVTAIAIGSQPAALAGLEHGKLDAWSGFDPGVSQLRKRHSSVRILADARTQAGVREIFGTDAYPGSVLYAKPDWLARNPDSARRLARAILGSLRWIHQHTPDEIMRVVPQSHFGEDRAVYREALVSSMNMFSQDGRMPARAPEIVKKVVGASLEKVRTGHIDLAKTFTDEFVAGQ